MTQVQLLFSRFQSRDSDTESVTSTDLFVEGIAISARGEYFFFSKCHKVFPTLFALSCFSGIGQRVFYVCIFV